ncbi:unnamed protein product [Spirodela intermedia]|uniref:BAG domain-containing protein n=1 Tax=Spirodela intermedia TaxID=51605 RepID=A0A7I8JTG6_SPIIN|nr:unnamed protein product [Spirodela intermedia]CAA6672913.1 unnamed protein product [Spirodela intermedia]
MDLHGDKTSQSQHAYPGWEPLFNYFGYPPADYNAKPSHPLPQLPQHYFLGPPYPPYANFYPPYFAPPTPCYYYPDQTRGHYYGCPNHSCQDKEDSALKTDEKTRPDPKDLDSPGVLRWPAYPYPPGWHPLGHMKDGDHKTSNRVSDNGSPAMMQWPAFTYPPTWFSPGHTKDDDDKSVGTLDDAMTRWIPFDMNSLKSLADSTGKISQSQQNGTNRSQFPLPIVWMPNHDRPKEVDKKASDAGEDRPRILKELPSKFKVIPINYLEHDSHNEKPGVEATGQGEKGSRPKNIPVRQIEESRPKPVDDQKKQPGCGTEKSSVSGKQEEEKHEKKDSSIGKEASLGKSSKLPPVCLRVDPLPRKKSGNSLPRSHSPPENSKEASKGAAVDKEVRIIEPVDKTNTERESEKNGTGSKIRLVEIEGGSAGKVEQPGKIENESASESSEISSRTLADVAAAVEKTADGAKPIEDNKRVSSNPVNLESTVEESTDSMKACGEIESEENKGGRRCKLSDDDAALLIQSVYRGFQVRRWEPLKKLRHIESSGRDERQKLFIGETIMNLLLQLDTIQGLHPRVREIRKSIANSLVSLQEELDKLSVESQKNPKNDLEEAKDQSNESTEPVGSIRLGEHRDSPVELESSSGDHEKSLEFALPSTDAEPTVLREEAEVLREEDSPPPTADPGSILDPPPRRKLQKLPRQENLEPEVSKAEDPAGLGPEENSEDAGGEKEDENTVTGRVQGERDRAGEAEELREEQLAMMSSLNGRVKDLERKVAGRRKLRQRQPRPKNSLRNF